MNKVRIIVRVITIICLLGFYSFLFLTSNSKSWGTSTGKFISASNDIYVFEVFYSEVEIELENANEFEMIEGQWYEIQHYQESWGYYPLWIEIENSYKLMRSVESPYKK